MNYSYFIGACLYLLASSCNPTNVAEQNVLGLTQYKVQKPKAFVKMHLPVDNPMTMEGVALGRKLFYDPILSLDSTLSCASCHQQVFSFTDGQALSTGVQGKKGIRSALSLINIGFHYTTLFWDGRGKSLEEQVLLSVEDTLELGNNWEVVETKLQEHPTYAAAFKKVFGLKHPNELNRTLVAKAIAQFERTLISANSKYDQVQNGIAQFSVEEQRGWSIFFDAAPDLPDSECAHCHIDPLFTDLDFFNNGIDAVEDLNAFEDKGRGHVTGTYYDNGKFRTPTLRNIELTAPYMHDGRFTTLEEVIDHYIDGGHHAVNASPNVRKLALNAGHKQDLIAFLKTLTDRDFVENEAFSNPWQEE